MSSLPRFILSVSFALCVGASGAAAQTPSSSPGDPFLQKPNSTDAGKPVSKHSDALAPHFSIAVEVFALPKQEALSVLENRDANASQYQQVQALARAGKARFENLMASTAAANVRGGVQSVDEFRYGTEWNPAETKDEVPIATAFETRDTGDILDFEITAINDAQTADLMFILKRTGLVRMQELAEPPNDPPVLVPIFRTPKLNAPMRVTIDQPQLVGTLNAPSPDELTNNEQAGEVSLVFVQLKPLVLEPSRSTGKGIRPLRVEYSFYSVDRALASEIVAAKPNIGSSFEQLQAMLQKGQARLEHITVVPVISGLRSTGEECTELRYPAEFNPPGYSSLADRTTKTVETKVNQPKSGENPNNPQQLTTSTRETVEHWPAPKELIRNPGTPTAFETRNLGLTIEQDVTLNESETAGDMQVVLNNVVHLDDIRHKGIPTQPLMERRTLRTSCPLSLGEHVLLGTLNPPGPTGIRDRKDSGRTWLVFVRLSRVEP